MCLVRILAGVFFGRCRLSQDPQEKAYIKVRGPSAGRSLLTGVEEQGKEWWGRRAERPFRAETVGLWLLWRARKGSMERVVSAVPESNPPLAGALVSS